MRELQVGDEHEVGLRQVQTVHEVLVLWHALAGLELVVELTQISLSASYLHLIGGSFVCTSSLASPLSTPASIVAPILAHDSSVTPNSASLHPSTPTPLCVREKESSQHLGLPTSPWSPPQCGPMELEPRTELEAGSSAGQKWVTRDGTVYPPVPRWRTPSSPLALLEKALHRVTDRPTD